MSLLARGPLEMWGGLECTVNRVGDVYMDQVERTGHAQRASDLLRIATLGLRTLRYPVLWERHARGPRRKPDLGWAVERVERLRELGITPIVGLLHHGSGPEFTDLLDPDFPKHFAEYAHHVAEALPWVQAYTPVNEPLTTARFSALYGLWYPHQASALAFGTALVHQCRAVALGMQAIRAVQSDALLVQTEDLGFVRSTPPLAYQASFENERRWLTFDLLEGRVTEAHPMARFLTSAGVPTATLRQAEEAACPPDVLGINYYVTSERFLDHRVEHYPAALHGGNGRHAYADTEAVRACHEGLRGITALLLDAWQRYRRPLAVTEAHLGCDRNEQMRWLLEIWDGAHAARAEGADVRAVTTWALLGSFDWSSLLTRDRGEYECGAFDVRTGTPRETALASLVACLARGVRPRLEVLGGKGWWKRPARILYPDAADQL